MIVFIATFMFKKWVQEGGGHIIKHCYYDTCASRHKKWPQWHGTNENLVC